MGKKQLSWLVLHDIPSGSGQKLVWTSLQAALKRKKPAISTIVSSLQSLPQLIWNPLQKLWSRKGWNPLQMLFYALPYLCISNQTIPKWTTHRCSQMAMGQNWQPQKFDAKKLKMTNIHGHRCHFHPWYNYKIIYPHNVTMISVSYHHYLFG